MSILVFFPLWIVTDGPDTGNVLFFQQSGCPDEATAKAVHVLVGPKFARAHLAPHGVKRLDYDEKGNAPLAHRLAMTPFGVAAVIEGPAIHGKTADGEPIPENRIFEAGLTEEDGRVPPEREAAWHEQFDENGKLRDRRTLH